jgi:hypothetical protein
VSKRATSEPKKSAVTVKSGTALDSIFCVFSSLLNASASVYTYVVDITDRCGVMYPPSVANSI